MSESRITDVARITGTHISTLRLWEQHGLISPKRNEAGQRIYSNDDIEKIRAIQRLRQVEGLNMSAIRKALFAPPPSNSAQGISPPTSREPEAETSELGNIFRLARKKIKLSLKEVSSKTGLPASLISTFERTSQGATVSSLQSLASCYGTTVTELSRNFSEKTHKKEIVRHTAERVLPKFGPGIKILQLADSLDLLDCQKWILHPGAESSGFYSHEGEEFIHVLSGEFQISLEGSGTHILHCGDSISFESHRPHSWRATGNEETILIWVNTPKSY